VAYQFVHLETYSRKSDSKGRSVGWVLSEAAREPGASPHVPRPLPPEIVFGVSLDEVGRQHDQECDVARVTLANGRTRALRKDQKTLLTVVASHPAKMDQVRTDSAVAADVTAWEGLTVAWLQKQYGPGLLSVVRHVDESHPHLHAYILPDDLRAARLHPGNEAKRLVTVAGPQGDENAKALNRRGDAAYKSAMRQWQDSYHNQVGVRSGLARLGPGRRRLSREQWQTEAAAARSTKLALDRASLIDRKSREYVTKTKSAAAAVVSAAQEKASLADRQAANAKALHDEAAATIATAREKAAAAELQAASAKYLQATAETKERKASAILDRAGQQAERIVAEAESRASRISSWGSRIRSFIDGLRRSSIVEAARRAASQAVERERVRADDAARRVLEETERRREAERRERAAAQSVQETARERDQARRELSALRPAVSEVGMGRRVGR
jgi:hypothetical protein